MSSATAAIVVACHAVTADTWRRTNPSVFSTAVSRRRRRTDVTSTWPSAPMAMSASTAASSSGVPRTRV
jgi:hypothetical protein